MPPSVVDPVLCIFGPTSRATGSGFIGAASEARAVATATKMPIITGSSLDEDCVHEVLQA
jgi:hypothetical protein